jgi:hypothetical protein
VSRPTRAELEAKLARLEGANLALRRTVEVLVRNLAARDAPPAVDADGTARVRPAAATTH